MPRLHARIGFGAGKMDADTAIAGDEFGARGFQGAPEHVGGRHMGGRPPSSNWRTS